MRKNWKADQKSEIAKDFGKQVSRRLASISAEDENNMQTANNLVFV